MGARDILLWQDPLFFLEMLACVCSVFLLIPDYLGVSELICARSVKVAFR